MEGISHLLVNAEIKLGQPHLNGLVRQPAPGHFVDVDRSSDEVRFNHQVFREYFQASTFAHAAEKSGRLQDAEPIGLVVAPATQHVARTDAREMSCHG